MYKYVKYITVILALTAPTVVLAEQSVATSTNDPMVMKIYPDGTKVVVRWSEIGKAVDNGEKHGGAPRIIAYDPGKDGIVPIGQPAATVATPQSTPTPMPPAPSASSVVTPEQKSDQQIIEKTNDSYLWGPKDGFCVRASAGPAWTSALKFKSTGPTVYNVQLATDPGLRFDCAPGYNFNEYLRFEVEGAFIYNKGHRVTVSGGDIDEGSVSAYENNRFGFSGSGAIQVPIIPQLAFSVPIDGAPIRPTFGGGFGPSWLSISSTEFDVYSSSWNCAWQAYAGFDINVAEGVDFSMTYKALGTINPNLNSQGPAQSFYTQSANIGLTCRF
jgi:opacity protein-like surface antigen